MLVDDEDAFLRHACAFFESDGHTVVPQNDADQVLHSFHQNEPDIVVLDVDLGHKTLDGRMLCADIVKTERYQLGSVGIILISGHYINPGDELAGFTVGADNYLIKPFELSQLAIRIEALSRRLHRPSKTKQITSGELFIDKDSREVYVGDTLVELSKLEFNVLLFLAESPGTVKTKSDLLEQVWSTIHVEDSAVAKCISLLRKKLSAKNPEAFIKTVYAVGYLFVDED